MFNDLINIKYRDTFSINSKYNYAYVRFDEDDRKVLTILINYGLHCITCKNEWENFYQYSLKDKCYYCNGTSTANINHIFHIRVSGQKMMKYVRLGIMYYRKDLHGQNIYYFPSDFFTTNDLRIKFKNY